MIRINDIIECSQVNGPGKRYTIWVQGCSIHCKDCANKDTWDFCGGTLKSNEELIEEIDKYNIDGITLTGGEPLDQYEGTLEFLKKIKEVFPEFDIFLTSGYSFEYIKKNKSDVLNYVDILVTGPFVASLLDTTTSWRGSTNQKIHFLTERSQKFRDYKPKYRKEIKIKKKDLEKILGTGFTDPAILRDLIS